MWKKVLIVLLACLEALAAASVVVIIAFSDFMYSCEHQFPTLSYQGQTSFDHVIVDGDGTEYPAGTVFDVTALFRNGQMQIYYDTKNISTGSPYTCDISEALNSAELYAALDQLVQKEKMDLVASSVMPSVISLSVYVSLFAFFIHMNKKLKIAGRIILMAIVSANGIFLAFFSNSYMSKAKAPIIYLYPEEETVVNVQLSLDGNLTSSYPRYNEDLGWTVTASPDGTLTDGDGREYEYLFWEGDLRIKPDLSHGFCVKGEDTVAFLEDALAQLGLTDKEADTFIMFWLPQLESNKYNVITFQTEPYEDAASLEITPAPDTVIRVNMFWYPVNSYVDMKAQDLASLNPDSREGFTVVEWGGEKYERGIFDFLVR